MEEEALPEEVVLKVFKTTLNEFKNRDKYIKDDYRFKDRFSKLNPRKVIRLWAEKEMHNLVRMKKAGILCLEVVILKKHILVMSFIGQGHVPAPKLKDALLSSEDMKLAYYQVLDFFDKAGVDDVMNVYDLFNAVSVLQIHGDNEADFLAQIEALEKMNEDHVQKCSKKTFLTSDDGPPLKSSGEEQ